MKFYSTKEVATLLELSEETVRRLIREGKLDAEVAVGRGGSKISDIALRSFLTVNKSYVTSAVSSLILPLAFFPGIGLIGSVVAGAAIAALANKEHTKNIGLKDIVSAKQQLSIEILALQKQLRVLDINLEFDLEEIEVKKKYTSGEELKNLELLSIEKKRETSLKKDEIMQKYKELEGSLYIVDQQLKDNIPK